jgi:SAM-dependent methyltransferase
MDAFDDHTRDEFYAELYEQTTAPFVSAQLTLSEVQCFRRLTGLESRARVLDLGCGWGRHLEALREDGFDAIGLERSASLATKAATRGPVVRGDLRTLPFKDGSFDAAACFYSSIFFFDEKDNLAALAEVARVLRPGGAFVLQAANPLYLKRIGLGEQTHRLPDGRTVYERTEFDRESGRDVGFRRLTRPDGTTMEGRFSVRHYAPGELEVMGRRVGFRLDRVCGDLTLSAYARHSRELIVLMRRMG